MPLYTGMALQKHSDSLMNMHSEGRTTKDLTYSYLFIVNTSAEAVQLPQCKADGLLPLGGRCSQAVGALHTSVPAPGGQWRLGQWGEP